MLNLKSQILNFRVWLLKFVILIFLGYWGLEFGALPLYASGVDTMRNYFLSADYTSCIAEGEKLIADTRSSKGLDEVYYMLGLSYLKEGNYLRASDIFEIVLNEYKSSAFKEEARLGLGDSFFLRGDLDKAEHLYRQIIQGNNRTKLKPAVYYRLSQVGKRSGNRGKEQEFRNKLREEFPQSPEALSSQEMVPASPMAVHQSPAITPHEQRQAPQEAKASPATFFSVQVGAFSSRKNAENLAKKLSAQGYFAFIGEGVSQNKSIFKVRVGNYATFQEARSAEKKLILQGYPTKIIP